MKIIELTQGSPEWQVHRAKHFNASDAPAMLGVSPYKTRAQLLKELATGLGDEIDPDQQRRFDEGHRAEALARPLAEEIIGDDLFPVVGAEGRYSASFDGLTLTEDAAFEHKSLNDDLRAVMVPGCTGADMPKAYRVQMEQQCMVSGAQRVLFMASKWAGEVLIEQRHCWYAPDPVLRAEIVAGWKQFEADLSAYTPEAATPVAVGRAPDQLPALFVQIAGGVQATNLPEFKAAAIEVFRSIRTDLATDQDFADAEKAVKFCSDVEAKLKGAKDQALGQTASIDELFRTIDAISAEARAKRLELNNLVQRRKDEIRAEVIAKAAREVEAFRESLNQNLAVSLPAQQDLRLQLTEAIKGKRTVTSLQDSAAQVVANAKLAATATAERYRANLTVLAEAGRPELFADRDALVRSKAPEDLGNLVRARIAEADLREQRRQDEERARIRREEEERAQREAAQNAERERQRIRDEEAAKLRENPPPPPVPQAELPNPQAVTASAPAVANSAPAPAPPAQEAGGAPVPASARIKLGDINARIAPLSISAEGLAQLGFHAIGTERAAKLYAASAFPAICKALVAHLQAAAVPMKEAA